jgi:hypothetical protein
VDKEQAQRPNIPQITTERGIVIESDELEEIIEYEYRNNAERDFEFPASL